VGPGVIPKGISAGAQRLVAFSSGTACRGSVLASGISVPGDQTQKCLESGRE
jgi:hypothetical protein